MEHDDFQPSVVFVYTDGGSDHRLTLKSVQLSLIALFLVNDLDLLVAARTCPGHSFANPAERVMATLNLGLQNAAFARESMPAASEAAIKSCMSMAEIRNVAGKSSELKTHWEKSIDSARSCISQRFNRLLYCNKQIRVLDEVRDDNMRKARSDIWSDIDFTKLTAKDLADKEDLNRFLQSHCRIRRYSFQVKCDVNS